MPDYKNVSFYLPVAIAVGIGATIGMDLWNLFLKRALGVPSLNYCLLGRWLSHITSGTFTHTSIAASESKPFECGLGWIAHYSIGIAFAVGFVVLAPREWIGQPSVLPAVLYGVATVVIPFFVMQPAMGLGIAGSKTPKPAQARLKSLATHTVFGLGLYLAALGIRFTL